MLDRYAEEDEENLNMMPKKIMKSRHNVGEQEAKEGIESRYDAGELEKKNIESGHDAGEPKKKKKGSNSDMMPENLKQKERIKSHDVKELETK